MSFTAQRREGFCLNERSNSRLLRRSLNCISTFVALCSLFIAPARGADLVGATAGELGVSPAGSASYSIPIAVPPGTTGLQPKITLQYDSLAGHGPQSFRVWRKSGEILEFGFTVDSRIEALGRGDNSVWVWALNKLSDTYGNYETFSYTEDAVNGGFRISRIDYTGNAGQSLGPYDRIDFVYASRSDPATTYQAGSKVTL